ncbi:MAG: hypothetical protein LBT68_06965 [Spirochaetales bacterium]|nr:hypothetical protein [Spirochaetales bacterium]
MKKKKNKTPGIREKIEAIHIILLILGIVFLAGFIVLAVYFLRTTKYSADLSYSLENIDALIKSGDYEGARKNIEGMRAYPDYPGDWMRLLKRCRILALQTGDGELFSAMALWARDANPDSEDIAAVAAAALMDAGRHEEAASLLGRFEGLDYRSFAAEIHVRNGTFPEEAHQGELVYAVLPESRDYLDFIMAAELSGESAFFLDAALLLLEAGRREEALSVLYASGVGDSYPYITALASYDAGKTSEAGSYWDRMPAEEKMLPRSLQLRADSFLRQRRYDESENVHEIFLYNYPEHSPVSYLALNFLSHRKTPFSGMPTLQKGLALFPRNSSLMLDYAKNLIAENRKAEGEDVAGKIFLDYSAGDANAAADARALAIIAQREEIPLGRVVSELWMLHNDYPDSLSIPALLRWHLFSLNDYPAIRLLLEQGRAKEDEHSLSYLAALDFAEGGLVSARETLARQTTDFPACPEGFYNLGLVYTKMRLYKEALGAFQDAAALIDFSETDNLDEHIHFRIFDTLILLGRFSEASAELRRFLDLNPHHPEALQKLRKLEARGE